MGPDEIQTEFIPSVCTGYQSYPGGSAVLGASGTTFLNIIPGMIYDGKCYSQVADGITTQSG